MKSLLLKGTGKVESLQRIGTSHLCLPNPERRLANQIYSRSFDYSVKISAVVSEIDFDTCVALLCSFPFSCSNWSADGYF